MKHAREDYNNRIVDLQNKIPEDEPVFILRGQDKLAPALLLEWAKQLRLNGGDPKMARIAEDHAQDMIKWQKERGSKIPDLYQDSQEKEPLRLRINEIIDELISTKIIINATFVELDKLIKSYYGDDEDIYVLTESDLLDDYISEDDLSVSHFKLDVSRYNSAKLVIYIGRTKYCKIIKNRVNNKLYND
jgi:hypothetical protein